MDYLNEKRSTPFEVQAFTNVESLKEFASEQEIEILLISTRAMCNEIRELPISRVVILSEGEQFQETDLEYPFVYKYQSSDQLISEVMEYYAGTNPSTCLLTTTVKTKLIGVYSPVGRSGKTSFALALGEILAETKQVLYLNLEEYSGFEKETDVTMTEREQMKFNLKEAPYEAGLVFDHDQNIDYTATAKAIYEAVVESTEPEVDFDEFEVKYNADPSGLIENFKPLDDESLVTKKFGTGSWKIRISIIMRRSSVS